ncbi:MAG: YggS family pyridoxal phosphate-dependent enzyme [Bacilli bacterium]|nr:YggS family pyridoxal phosphate-dependent enzyme [Bacilli bacterium]
MIHDMVREDLKEFISTIPNNVTIVAATKYVDANDMRVLYENGIKDFGENRVDSFLTKYEKLGNLKDINWHFIGHLQRNKAKKIINKIDYLHSLDSIELAKEIDKLRETPLNVFVEVSINLEENKNGVPYYELENFIDEILPLKNINIVGLMMMAYKDSDNPEIEFKKLADLRDKLVKTKHIPLKFLSMGMSDDYLAAIKAGATHIRLGRILYK